MLMNRLRAMTASLKERCLACLPVYDFSGLYLASVLITVVLVLTALASYSIYVSIEPPLFDVIANEKAALLEDKKEDIKAAPPGYLLTTTLIKVTDTLLHKRGGYLRNDVMPPTAWLDNMPNWEGGVLVQVRDLTRVMRRSMARSQSQSIEDPYLAIAEPHFSIDSERWLFPAAENEYEKGNMALVHYRKGLFQDNANPSYFYPRADNLADWLGEVSKRLGTLSQRLSQSVGVKQIPGALHRSVDNVTTQMTKTAWFKTDDVFYETRGATWALVQLLKAAEVEFHDVLLKKNAIESMQQIIRDLEVTQDTVWSPMILNGDLFGILANHSLEMAAFVAQSNAAIIDLHNLLIQG